MTILSGLFLIIGIIAYGLGAAHLSTGSKAGAASAVRSRIWWTGTMFQGVGFIMTFLARRSLPTLTVQTTVVGAVAVTAIVEHLTKVRRLTLATTIGVLLLVAGVAGMAFTSVPGPVSDVSWPVAAALAVSALVSVTLLALKLTGGASAVVNGLASGFGFGISALAARGLMGNEHNPPWRFWELPLLSWEFAVLVLVGLVLGQIFLTRGLSSGDSMTTLGCMYGGNTVMVAVYGSLLFDERVRSGAGPVVLAGLAAGVIGTAILLRAHR